MDQIALLDMALRFNPDIIVVGEMRGPEANAAQEAARTGVAVVTTIIPTVVKPHTGVWCPCANGRWT